MFLTSLAFQIHFIIIASSYIVLLCAMYEHRRLLLFSSLLFFPVAVCHFFWQKEPTTLGSVRYVYIYCMRAQAYHIYVLHTLAILTRVGFSFRKRSQHNSCIIMKVPVTTSQSHLCHYYLHTTHLSNDSEPMNVYDVHVCVAVSEIVYASSNFVRDKIDYNHISRTRTHIRTTSSFNFFCCCFISDIHLFAYGLC